MKRIPTLTTAALLWMLLCSNTPRVLALGAGAIVDKEYLPLTDASVREAVSLWTSDKEGDRAIALDFYGPIESWATGLVTDMSRLFRNQLTFNEDISQWDVSAVTSMQLMLYGASSFSYDLSAWNISSAVNLGGMFVHASNYSHSICWPMLSKFAFVEEMFCGTAGATLDPCCVDEVFVKSACCGDSCSSFCFETVTPSPTTATPTATPTGKPTVAPSRAPTESPTGPPTTQPTGIPSGMPTWRPSEGPTANPTLEPTQTPTENPTNATTLYTEPHITIVNFVNPNASLLHPPPPYDGFYSNDEPTQQTTTPIGYDESPQVVFSQGDPGYRQQEKGNSKKSGWIGATVGFLVGAVAIASMVVVRRHYQNKRRDQLALFGKEYDEEGIEVQLDGADDDTLVEGPKDDEEAPECPIPKLEDMNIAIQQRSRSCGDEAVELSFDNTTTFDDYDEGLYQDPEDEVTTTASFEDALQSEGDEDGNVLPRIELREVRAYGRPW